MQNSLTPIARKLRKERNPFEVKMWARLRARRFFGLKFHRQFVIGEYVADFCCREKHIVIELDGGQHDDQVNQESDQVRDAYLRSQGYKVIRVWNNDFEKQPEIVLEKIHLEIRD
ncbi:MAG: endonuclease domain-containing protein [Patescibacteria group bacterium]